MDSDAAAYFEFDDPAEPRISYLVCSIPRSGSNLLGELLFASGVAGVPTELFHPHYMRVLKRHWGIETTEEYVRELLARKTGPNGVFGAKAHWGQYHPLFGNADPRALLPNLRVISIARRDHLRQAVSWVRALQTFSWRSDHTRPERPLEFDPEHITRKLGRIGREEDAWRALFDRYGIEPHEIVYEDLVADRDRTIREALAFIGVEPPADFQVEQPTLERQADALSEQWVERYIAETAHT
jgi:LPS sulfotransferase NodH